MEAIAATHGLSNYVKLYTSLSMSSKLGIYPVSASLVDEREPRRVMTYAYEECDWPISWDAQLVS